MEIVMMEIVMMVFDGDCKDGVDGDCKMGLMEIVKMVFDGDCKDGV